MKGPLGCGPMRTFKREKWALVENVLQVADEVAKMVEWADEGTFLQGKLYELRTAIKDLEAYDENDGSADAGKGTTGV